MLQGYLNGVSCKIYIKKKESIVSLKLFHGQFMSATFAVIVDPSIGFILKKKEKNVFVYTARRRKERENKREKK